MLGILFNLKRKVQTEVLTCTEGLKLRQCVIVDSRYQRKQTHYTNVIVALGDGRY